MTRSRVPATSSPAQQLLYSSMTISKCSGLVVPCASHHGPVLTSRDCWLCVAPVALIDSCRQKGWPVTSSACLRSVLVLAMCDV